MKVISIGDIHGKTCWTQIVKDNPDADKFVFAGDYVDSFDVTNTEIISNLLSIIEFKKQNMDKVILVLGNHDIQYMYSNPEFKCSGYRPEMYFQLNDIFMSNLKLFQYAYQCYNTIWTHAGITKQWVDFAKVSASSVWNYSESIVDFINNLGYNSNHGLLHIVDKTRGGSYDFGGPTWCSKELLKVDALDNINQIVGHTWSNQIEQFGNLTFVDCLPSYYISNHQK